MKPVLGPLVREPLTWSRPVTVQMRKSRPETGSCTVSLWPSEDWNLGLLTAVPVVFVTQFSAAVFLRVSLWQSH